MPKQSSNWRVVLFRFEYFWLLGFITTSDSAKKKKRKLLFPVRIWYVFCLPADRSE
jgi:hypothetical protein